MSENEHWTEAFRETLHNHEEPYQLGAWERFEAQRTARVRHRMWRRVVSVAALMLLGLGLYWFGAPETEPGREMVLNGGELPAVREPGPRSIDLNPDDGDQESATASRSDDPQGRSEGRSDEAEMESGDPDAGSGIPTRNESMALAGDTGRDEASDPFLIDSPITGSGMGLAVPSAYSRGEEPFSIALRGGQMNRFRGSRSIDRAGSREEASFSDSPAVRASDLRLARRDRAFAWGVAYAPMMNLHGGTARMAMGAGVHARVELGNAWGLGSALVLSRSQFQSDADPADVNLFQASPMADGAPTVLDSRVEADLVSLEVPLHLRYEVSESVALSGGLSTVAYLQETYRYRVDYRQSYSTARSTEQGVQFESGERERTEQMSESETPMSGLYWGAFYNMGAEFSWLLSNRHLVSVEPFVKIPTGGVAKQDLTYSSGGVQLKLYF